MVPTEQASEPRALIGRLSVHWSEGLARLLLHRLVAGLECGRPVDVTAWEGAMAFGLDLSRIYLGGLGERVGALLIGGRKEGRGAARFWDEWGQAGGVVLVFCANDEAYAEVVRALPPRYCLVLRPGEVSDLLAAPVPRRRLTEHLAARLGRTFMSVYDISKPATQAFFGRARELNRLVEDVGTSYAVTGPGRIGKTSLLRRYAETFRRRSDHRATPLVTIDCTELPLDDQNAVARRIATRIHASPKSQRVTANDLLTFLRETKPAGAPIELLIDEADAFCFTEPFRQLGQAAREGYVRLIVCGRKGVHDYALREVSVLAHRLEIIHLGPLQDPEARDLIVLPMADLGIDVDADPSIVRRLLDQTGRLPHLIQYYCKHLVDRLSGRRGDARVTLALIAEIESEYEFHENLLGPLFDLREGPAYDVAVGLLQESTEHFRLADVEAVAVRLGHPLEPRAVKDLCDELVVHNILMWDRSAYRLSCQALRMSAERSGLLR